jgi:phage I-like protein
MESGSLFLPLDNKQGEIPKRIQLLPPGPNIEGRDGRTWIMRNSESVVSASNAWLPNHPIDENHAIDLKVPQGGSSPAFGWFSNISVESNGSIWADVEWTKRGAEAVANLEYRYVSPVIVNNEKGEISTILRAALSNSPNLDIKSLNAQEPEAEPGEEEEIEKIIHSLGYTPEEWEIIKKIAKNLSEKSP